MSLSVRGSNQVSFKKLAVVWTVIATHCLQPIVAMADVVADANSAHRPTVDATNNGTPIVNITTPSAGGVSRNQYTEFSINSQGVLLNNNHQKPPVSSSQAQLIQQNPHLMGSDAARVILNEITSTNRSHLNGDIEVVGSSADVVVANPNGITCNGCGFINTSRGVLTTGMPVFGGQGSLESFRVSSGDILIDSEGLNGSETQQLDLLTRALQVRGPIWAEELNAIVGSNEIDFNQLTVTEIANETDAPSIGIDVANLGGMYAGKIHLISTEAGVGVNNAGEIGSTVDDVVIDSSGRVSFGGKVSAATDVEVNTEGEIALTGSVYAQESVDFDTAGTASISGTLEAENDITLDADGVTVTESGTVLAGDLLSVDSNAALHNAGELGSENTINLQAETIEQHGTVTASNTVHIESETGLVNSGTIHGDVTGIQANQEFDNTGTLSAVSELNSNTGNINNATSGTIITTNGDLNIGSTGSLNNLGNIESQQGGLQITVVGDVNNAAAFDGTGNLDDSVGNLIAGDDLVVSSQSSINNTGTVYSGANASVSAADTVNNNGLMIGENLLSVWGNRIFNILNNLNDGAFVSTAGDVVLTGGALVDNQATIFAARDVHLAIENGGSGNIVNHLGALIESEGDIALGIACVRDASGRCAADQSGSMGDGYRVVVTNDGAINSLEDIYVLAHRFTNNMAPIQINGARQIGAFNRVNEGFTGRYDNVISGADMRPAFGGYHVPFRVSSLYRDWTETWVTRESFGNDPYSPTMTAQQNFVIRTNDGENIGGTLAAGSTMSLSSLSGGGSFINQSHKIYQYNHRRQGRDAWDCNLDLACAFRNNLDYLGRQNVSYNVQQILYDSRGGIMQVNNGGFSASGLSFINDGDRGQNLGVNIGGVEQPIPERPEIDFQLPNFPIGNNGLFVESEAPDSNYIYISNPKYQRNTTDALSTDYLLSLLNINSDNVLRLGDGLYEQRLLRDQILNQTGRAWITDATTVEDQFSELMDAGYLVASNFDLQLGEPLSDAQQQALEQDIIWLTTKEINGVNALVPQLYLSDSTKNNSDKGQVLADSLIMDVESFTNDGGGFVIENDATIIAKGDAINSAGLISADNLAIISTDGSVINETKVERIGDSENYQDVAYQGELHANNAMILSGQTGVDIIGATVDTGGSVLLHSESGDINIESLKLESKQTQKSHSLGFLSSSSEETVTTQQSLNEASVSAGSNSSGADSQLTIVANAGDVNVTGAVLNSAGNINIAANDVNVSTIQLESSTSTRKESSGIQNTEDGLFIGASSSASDEFASEAQGSQFTADNGINIQAQNDIVLQGGRYESQTARLEAGNDVRFEAAENTYSYSESAEKAGLSMGSSTQKDDEGNVTGHTASIGVGANSHQKNINSTEYTNATITAADGLAIQANNTVDIGGLTAAVTNVPDPVQEEPDTNQDTSESQQENEVAGDAEDQTPSSLFGEHDLLATQVDVNAVKDAAMNNGAGSLISENAESGAGIAEAFGEMDLSNGVGSLSVTANNVVSTKYKNKYDESNQSSSTYIGVSVSSDKDSVGAGFSAGYSESDESLGLKADNISSLSGANVSISGKDGIDLKGVEITGTESVSLASEGDINISAAETEETYHYSSSGTSVGIGFEMGVTDSDTNLTGAVDTSLSLNIGHESQQVSSQANGHQDSVLSSEGALNIVSDSGDVAWVGVSADAADLAISADNFSSEAYEDSATHSESSTALGISLTASTDIGKMTDDFLGGNGMSASSLDSKSTQEVGNTIVANNATIQVKDNVTIVGGDVVTNNLGIQANTVDMVAAKSTLEKHKTESSVSLTADGSAAIAGYKAYGSIDSMSGEVESGTMQNSGHADRTGHGRTNSGKAISDELVTGKAGLSIKHRTEDTTSTQYTNANLQFNQLVIDTTNESGTGDGHVDIGGANLLAFADSVDVPSSINIATGELKTTKYVDRTETNVHDNSTFIGVAAEAHSAVADTVNHSKTLADKANEGMEVDAGWTTAQAAADASSMAMGDLAGASTSLTLRNMDIKTNTVATSENINYINADNINITTTQGDIALKGVEFNAPPTYNETTSEMEKAEGPRPQSIALDSARDVAITAAESTYTETSTTLTNDFNATLAGSVSSTGAGVNVDVGYNGSRSEDQLSRATYSNASVNAENVTIKANNLSLTGANVTGSHVNVDVANTINITSVQDTQTQLTTRSNYGGSVGAGIGTMGIVPSVNGQGGGGNSHDNSAITQQQSGILAENNLTLAAGGDVNLTGAHIAVAEGGTGRVNIQGDVNATALEDYRDKDGLFAGGGGGIDAAGVNVNVNFEKVDQVKYNATQNATIDVGNGSLDVAGTIDTDLNRNMENATNVTQDRKIAGVYSNGTGFVPRSKKKSQYDSNIVIITRDRDGNVDKTVEQSAMGLYNKHKKNTVVVKENPNSKTGFDVVKGDINKVGGKTRMNVVGKGGDLGGAKGKGSEVVAKLVKDVADTAKLTDKDIASNLQRVGIVACESCNKKGDKTLGEAVLRDLDKAGIKTEVSEKSGKIGVDYRKGTKVSYLKSKDEKATKRVLKLDKDKQLVVKETKAKRVEKLKDQEHLDKGDKKKENRKSKKRDLSPDTRDAHSKEKRKSLKMTDAMLVYRDLEADNSGVPPGFEGAPLRAEMVDADAANDAQYHVVTRGIMHADQEAGYRADTGVVQIVGRMNQGYFERDNADYSQGQSQVSLSRRGSIVLSRALGEEVHYTRISSGVTSEAIRRAEQADMVSTDVSVFTPHALAALKSPTNKDNDIANGAKTTVVQIKSDGLTPYNMSVATSLSGSGVKDSGKDHQKVMAKVTKYNTEGRRNERDKEIAKQRKIVEDKEKIITELEKTLKVKHTKTKEKKLNGAIKALEKAEAKIAELQAEKENVTHDPSSDSHSEPMGTSHTNQARETANLRPLEETPTLRLVTSHDRAVCHNCRKGFHESTGRREEGSLIVGEGWRPFGGVKPGFDADAPALYRVPPHETRVAKKSAKEKEAAEIARIYANAEGEGDHAAQRLTNHTIEVRPDLDVDKATDRLESGLSAIVNQAAKEKKSRKAKAKSPNEVMADQLLDRGFVVADNDGGANATDCLILSMLQHANREYDRQHDAQVDSHRRSIVERFGNDEQGMLYGDGPVLAHLAERMGLQVVMLHADLDGNIAMAQPVGADNAQQVFIWDMDGHFVALHQSAVDTDAMSVGSNGYISEDIN